MHALLLSACLACPAGRHDDEAAAALALAAASPAGIRPERVGRLQDIDPAGRWLKVSDEYGTVRTTYDAGPGTRWFVRGRETDLGGFRAAVFDSRGNWRRHVERVRLVLYLLDPSRCAEVHLLPPAAAPLPAARPPPAFTAYPPPVSLPAFRPAGAPLFMGGGFPPPVLPSMTGGFGGFGGGGYCPPGGA